MEGKWTEIALRNPIMIERVIRQMEPMVRALARPSGPMLTIELPDTPAMRKALVDLAVHAIEDEAPFLREPADAKPDVPLADAYEAFHDAVTRAIHPEVFR